MPRRKDLCGPGIQSKTLNFLFGSRFQLVDAITDVQHLLGHASVKTTEKVYAACVKNERFKQTIDLLDEPKQPALKIVK